MRQKMKRQRKKSTLLAIIISSIISGVPFTSLASSAITNTLPVIGHKPVANPVLSHTTISAGEKITVITNFSDPDGDLEDTSPTGTAYQWVVENSPGIWDDLTGKTEQKYIIPDTLRGKNISVKVTPKTSADTTEPFLGDEVLTPTNVTVAPISPLDSIIYTDEAIYVSGSDVALVVMLRDTLRNPVIGEVASVKAGITVPNATLKAGSDWAEDGGGNYRAIYTAGAEGSKMRASLLLNGWTEAAESDLYTFTTPVTLKDIHVNRYTYSKNAGFPTTGFTGAEFKLELNSPLSGIESKYTWSSNASWVSVTNGVVKFTGTGTGDKVTIMGVPKNGKGPNISYEFKLKSWYTSNGTSMLWSDADSFCNKQHGYRLPTVKELTATNDHSDPIRGTLSGLHSEWGALSQYPDSSFSSNSEIWALDQKTSDHHYFIYTSSGHVFFSEKNIGQAVCRKAL
ncbi:hypothetical protein NFJ76_11620 [Citrobacter freundii]|uniref:hypothetical protein n=1 Tax=Citrobacter freundii TaxID=546 RepID=UPI00242F4116|nr:hypothetical protein [Citrobacter freundii]WFW58464.1 hypothetical protein NFJ76_11620 [Citrobacter freundii]